ncbi:hypothetical protein FIBSPDRAFT_934919 [Athelia psychrophila]|uniref:RNA-dependent RNA polymerase n=1 Tax=Athelia psychrophila TaxID=1759441 RepID=A0A166EM77_9AGAM|nr:hypothetical protein FIBSPDRAFT_934919 [Fibularhizoctonia sp. CBS 109695]
MRRRPVAPSTFSSDEYQHRNRDPLVNGRQRRASSIILRTSRQHRLMRFVMYCARWARLAQKLETVTNLAENDVPHAVLSMLFCEELNAQVAPFTQWDGPDAMPNLWHHLAHVGNVMTARATRSSTADAKVMGCRVRKPEEAEHEDGIVDSDHVRTLDCKAHLRRERVAVLIAHTALIDPYERLGDDRIQVKSSWCEFATTGGADTDIILRDALLTRNPCKFPTDTRESEAVYKPQLANYTDVIVCSVKGHRRLADGSQATGKLQEYLLGGIQATSVVGVYSAFHDYAMYALGYTHPETITLTYMFFYPSSTDASYSTLLDLYKNGRVLMGGVMSGDFAKYGKRPPAQKESREDDDRHVSSTSNTLDPKRGHKLGQIIIDEFCKQAKDEGEITIGPRRNTRFTDLSIEVRQDILRVVAMDFAAGPLLGEIFIQKEIARLRASYAYLYDSEQQSQKWSRFPWDVCTQDLRDIKAHALGMTKTCTQDLYTRFTMKHSSFRRR